MNPGEHPLVATTRTEMPLRTFQITEKDEKARAKAIERDTRRAARKDEAEKVQYQADCVRAKRKAKQAVRRLARKARCKYRKGDRASAHKRVRLPCRNLYASDEVFAAAKAYAEELGMTIAEFNVVPMDHNTYSRVFIRVALSEKTP